VQVKKSIEKYRDLLKGLTHPSGFKLFGHYSVVDHMDDYDTSEPIETSTFEEWVVVPATYSFTNSTNSLIVTSNSHGLSANNGVSLEFYGGNIANLAANTSFNFSPNGVYEIASVINSNSIRIDMYIPNTIILEIGETSNGNVYMGKNTT
jgi:hypothetical protein